MNNNLKPLFIQFMNLWMKIYNCVLRKVSTVYMLNAQVDRRIEKPNRHNVTWCMKHELMVIYRNIRIIRRLISQIRNQRIIRKRILRGANEEVSLFINLLCIFAGGCGLEKKVSTHFDIWVLFRWRRRYIDGDRAQIWRLILNDQLMNNTHKNNMICMRLTYWSSQFTAWIIHAVALGRVLLVLVFFFSSRYLL